MGEPEPQSEYLENPYLEGSPESAYWKLFDLEFQFADMPDIKKTGSSHEERMAEEKDPEKYQRRIHNKRRSGWFTQIDGVVDGISFLLPPDAPERTTLTNEIGELVHELEMRANSRKTEEEAMTTDEDVNRGNVVLQHAREVMKKYFPNLPEIEMPIASSE